MSQDFMDPEIFAEFIVEAREHLETIEPSLLELEKTPDNTGLLNDIFRPMHSLKGASGFLGLNKINSLAHKAENILDELRTDKMRVSAEIMDVILSATDALTTMIDNLESSGGEGDVETRPILDHIEALLAGGGHTTAPAAPVPEPDPQRQAPQPTESAPRAEPAPSPAPSSATSPSAPVEEYPFDPTPYTLTVIGEGHLADFMEEAREIIENSNAALLEMEKSPEQGGDKIHDLFRFFHNLKGNSGIIGFKELNNLTHEAENLLNRARKEEIVPGRGMVDLLLAAVDLMEEMVGGVDVKKAEVTPVNPGEILMQLKVAVETGRFSEGEADGDVVESSEPAAAPASGKQDDSFDPEDVEAFRQTVEQQFGNIALALESLASDGSQKEYVDGLFRSLSTLQNSADYMGFDDLKIYAERTAGLVDSGRKSDMDFSLMTDILEQECAILKDMVAKELGGAATPSAAATPSESETVSSTGAEPAPEPAPEPVAEPEPAPEPVSEPEPAPEPASVASAPKPAAKAGAEAKADSQQKPKAASTIRVDHEKLDHLMNVIGELIINRNRFSMLTKALEEPAADIGDIAQSLSETTDAMARISDDLQDTIMKVRMVPVASVFSRFPRLVRDLSRKSGKKVELITEGEDTELDKSLVEVIGDPLVHLIRNSVDHGLETSEERAETTKSAVGKVWLRAYHKGNSVAIEVEDDGRGIDPEKMREVAVRKGVIGPEEAKSMDDRQAIELIFAPGFSSAEKITDISGRGVGMDVVRTNIKNLKGNVNVVSEVGKGTRFTMQLPLTLAIIDALMVTVDGDTFAIPLDAVSETTKIPAEKLSDVNSRKAITLRGEVLGIVELRELLGIPSQEDKREVLPVVIIHDNDRRLGIVVDRLLERQEIVIKPLGSYLSDFDLKGVSGATIMGDGSVVLILDPHEVYAMASQSTR